MSDSSIEVAGFKFYKALSMKALAEQLADDIASVQKAPVGPEAKFSLEPEIVLVSNRAQGIWLQQVIAGKNGICANVEFLLSGKFLGSRIGRRGKGTGTVDPFASDPLTLRIFKLLREKRDEKKELSFSFRDNSDEDLIAVAFKLAEVLASYQMLRPEMIEEWTEETHRDKDPVESAKGISESFLEEYRRQKRLWQELGFKKEELPAIRYLEFLSGELKDVDLPKRIFVFAPSSLPSMHFKLLKKLSELMPVYFYYHNLSKDLWTELRDEKQRLKDELRDRKKIEESQSHENEEETQLARELEYRAPATPRQEARWLEDEESLLTRRFEKVRSEPFKELLLLWGKAARPLAGALMDESLLDSSHDEAGNEQLPGDDTLLHAMQSEICRGPDIRDEQSISSSALSDESLLVHVAPSMFREVEILYDDLVRLFDRKKDLREKDVLIMFPNVEEYAPLIHAVFTNSAFRYTIADRSSVENFPGISAFFALLRVASGDVRVTEISELLEMEPIAKKLGLTPEEVPELQAFLRESNARWGLSEKDRGEKFGVKDSNKLENEAGRFFFNNSLAFGLHRGALGVMLGNEDSVLRFGNLEISESDVSKTAETAGMLGKLSKLLKGIKVLRKSLLEKEKREIGEWCKIFRKTILDELLDIKDIGESERLKSALNEIKEGNKKLGVTCEAGVVVELLKARSWEQLHDRGMLGGGITFCSLQPLRNIPAQAIYVGGMGWGKFPRGGSRSTLDLVSNWPTALKGKWDNWDTTAKERDNLLLLEILLSAKDYLRFSYVGHDVVSQKEIPPAPALAKIIEIAGKLSKATVVRNHKLHTFDSEEQSFCDIALAMGDKQAVADFVGYRRLPASLALTSFPLTEDEMKKFETLKLEDLANFFVDPAKFLCKKRLNLKSDWRDEPLSDDDPDGTRLELRDNVLKFFEEISKVKSKPFSFEEFLCVAKGVVKRETMSARARGELSAFTNEEEASEELLKSPGNDRHRAPKPSVFEKVVREILLGKSEEKTITPLESVTLSSDLSIEVGKQPRKVRVFWKFEDVFEVGGEMVFVEFPKKAAWGVSVYATVAAALIHENGEYKNFRVVAIDGKGETTATVTADSLEASGLTLEEIVGEFFEGLSEPPLLFWKTPLVETKRDRKGNVIEDTEEEKEGRYYEKAKGDLLDVHYSKDKSSPSVAPAESMEMRLVFGKDLSKSCMPLLKKSFEFVRKISTAVGKLET